MIVKNTGVTPITLNLRNGESKAIDANGGQIALPDSAINLLDDNAVTMALFNSGILVPLTDAGAPFPNFPTSVNAGDAAAGKLLGVQARVGKTGRPALVDNLGRTLNAGLYGAARAAAFGRPKLVIGFDSRAANDNFQSGLQNNWQAKGVADALQARSDYAFDIVQNGGVPSDTLAMAAARGYTGVRGRGFGRLNVDAVGGTSYSPTNAGLFGFGADVLLMLGMVNNRTQAHDQNVADASVLLDMAEDDGVRVVWVQETALGASTAGNSATQQANVAAFNRWLLDEEKRRPNLRVVATAKGTDTTITAAIRGKTSWYADDAVHWNNFGAWELGGLIWDVLKTDYPVGSPLFTTSAAEWVGYDASIPQWLQFPLLTAADLAGNGITVTTSGSGNQLADASLVAAPDGRGNVVQINPTFGAAADEVRVTTASVHARATEGDIVVGVMEAWIEGTGGAELAASHQLRTLRAQLRYTSNGSTVLYGVSQEQTGDIAMVGSRRRFFMTRPMPLYNVAQATLLDMRATAVGNGDNRDGGNPDVTPRIRTRFNIWKVGNVNNSGNTIVA